MFTREWTFNAATGAFTPVGEPVSTRDHPHRNVGVRYQGTVYDGHFKELYVFIEDILDRPNGDICRAFSWTDNPEAA